MAINFPANPTDGQQFSDEGVGYVYRADCSAWVGVVQTQSVPLAVADGGTGATAAAGARTNLGLGTLATRNTVGSAQIDNNSITAADIAANAVGASELNVANNGTRGQVLTSDGDGSFSWVNSDAVGGGGGPSSVVNAPRGRGTIPVPANTTVLIVFNNASAADDSQGFWTAGFNGPQFNDVFNIGRSGRRNDVGIIPAATTARTLTLDRGDASGSISFIFF